MKKLLRSYTWLLAIIFILSACSQTTASNSEAKENKKVADSGKEKVFHLYAGDLTQELSQGTTLYSWGFGLWDDKQNKPASKPTIPGPEIRVKEGDRVKIVFHNQQKEPHTIHFHGVDNSFEGDGTPGISQKAVEEGKTFTYEFKAPKAGTYFYHCHVEPDRHPEMGLYGAFIVEPKDKKTNYDGEFTLMLAERDPKLSLAEGTEAGKYVGTAAEHEHLDNGEYDTIARQPKYFTINGKIDPDIPPLKVKKGGTYLIRLINAGSDVHSIHIHGHHFKVVATDGREISNPVTKDTITIGPGERYDLVLKANNPGIFPLHCHMGPHGTHGMHTFIVYEGFENKLKEHEAYQLGKISHELAEMKEFLYNKNYEQFKVELGELSNNFNKIKNTLISRDKYLVKSIERTGAEIARNITNQPNQALLQSLMNQLEEQFNQAKETMEEMHH
jgi:FtsP/CotA-like multicopper oxidase with cupredoxin domain